MDFDVREERKMLVSVYVIPGGERASMQAYDELVLLMETHADLFLTVYRGRNRTDGQWAITLIGEQTSCARYHEQIQRPLQQVEAKLISVPPESQAPFIKRFLERQAEMIVTQTPFLVKHHPMSKKDYKKNKPPSSKSEGRSDSCSPPLFANTLSNKRSENCRSCRKSDSFVEEDS